MSLPISVVIPAHNAKWFITEAIQSIYAQTIPVSELIVVDDGSTDGTRWSAEAVIDGFYRYAKKSRKRRGELRWSQLMSRVLRQEQCGASAARNAGICKASQEWIAFLDADDIWFPDKIEHQWKMLELCPEAGIISCDHLAFRDDQVIVPSYLSACGNPQRRHRNSLCNELGAFLPRIEEEFFDSGWVLLPSTVMIRRQAFEFVGLFDEQLRGVEDFECFMRILTHYSLAVVERPLVRYRLHDNNTHTKQPLMQTNILKYFDLVIARPEAYPPGAVEAASRGRDAALAGGYYGLF